MERNKDMKKSKRIFSVILSTAMIFTASLSGFIPDGSVRAENIRPQDEEYAEGRVIVCVQEADTSGTGAYDETGSPSLFSLLPFGNTEKAESLLAGARELMDVSKACEETAAKPEEGLTEDEVSSEGRYAADSEGEIKTSLKVIASDKYSTQELIDRLSALPQVVFAEPDYLIHLCASGDQKAEDTVTSPAEEVSGGSYYAADEPESIPDLTAHQYSFGNAPGGIDVPGWNDPENINAEGTVTAVIDTGVDYTHPDLKDVMWDKGLEYDVLKEMGGGKYGYCSIPDQGYRSDDPMDDNGHGTICAGVLAAGWNGLGISGAANGTRILAVKMMTGSGAAYCSYALDSMNYILQAKKAGVNIVAVNCSWGWTAVIPSLEMGVRELSDNGVISVFSSGNDTSNADYYKNTINALSYTPGKLTVNSCDRQNQKSPFSNTGVRTTDLFAPGTAVLSAYINAKYPPAFLYRPSRDQNGFLMSNDFETGEGGYFETAAAGKDFDVSLSIESDPEAAGNHELRASFELPKEDINNDCPLISFTPRDIAPVASGQTDNVRFVMKCRTDADEVMLGVSVKTKKGGFSLSNTVYCEKTMESISLRLPKSMDLEAPELRLCLRSTINTDTDQKMSVWLDDCFLTTDTVTVPYTIDSGTSFATPAVTGEAAILAAAFPDDSVKKREARILGSVKRYDQYNGLCVTGGLANVRNALNGEYMPVVNDISCTPDGQLAISGYFFGNMAADRVKLTQYGTEHDCVITKLYQETDDPDAGTLYVKIPDGIQSGEVLVTVTDSARPPERQTGIRYRSISLPDHSGLFYERLPRWDDAAYRDLNICNIAGLNDTLYMSAYDSERSFNAQTRWFTLKGSDYSGIQDGPGYTSLMRSCCVYDRKLWCINPSGLKLIVYDPETGKKEEYSLKEFSDMPEGFDFDLVNYDINNTGEGILIFYTSENGKREVWRLDPFTLKPEKLLDLKAVYGTRNIYGLNVTEQGTEIYTGFGHPIEDENKTVMEKIIINSSTGDVSSELMDYDILPVGYTPSNEWIAGCGTRQGIYLAGGYKLMEGTDQIEADNWFFDYARPEKGFVPCEKKISSERLYEPAVCCYRGRVYFSGKAMDDANTRIIAYGDARGETWDLGEKPVVPEPQPEKAIISLKRVGARSLKLKTGASAVLSCRASYPAGMKEEDRPPLLYRSENEELLRVNPLTGELLAARPGRTRITASCGNKSTVFDITVSREASPSFLETELTLKTGEQYRLSFDPGYGTGAEKVVWTSLDKKTAVVKNGLITAKKAGTAVIRATVKDGSRVISTHDCDLTVEDTGVPKAQSKDKGIKLSLNKSSIKTKAGETINLKASLSGSDRDKVVPVSLVTNENLIEKSEDNDSQTGQVSGKKLDYTYSFRALAPGTAYITVTTSNPATGAQNTKVCRVTISAPARSISLSPDNAGHMSDDGIWVLKKGAVGRLKSEVSPENCTDTVITWKARGVAVSVKNGVISAKKLSRKDKKTGQYIPDTVTVKCGGITKSLQVIVEE